MDPKTRTYDKHWIPWLKSRLAAAGIPTEAPLMPAPWAPNYEKFRAEFEKCDINRSTVLVGHSCGCAFLVRWLGETKARIRKLVLVAPWKIDVHRSQIRKLFYTYPVDEGIRSRVGAIVMFTSDDEEDAGKQSVRIFHRALGGEVIELKGHGHYTIGDMGSEEFPELLRVVVQ